MRVQLKGILIKNFSQWRVTTFGIECRYLHKPIHKKHLTDQDFITETMRLNWVDEADFRQAIIYASIHHNIYIADVML